MRIVLAIATGTLMLGLASRPISAVQVGDNIPPLESIHMVDAQLGWATTTFGLVHTTTGGLVWEDARPVDSSGRRIGVDFLYAYSNVVWAQKGEPTETGGLLRTTDGGRTWKNIPVPAVEGVTQLAVSSISFINGREGWLLVHLSYSTLNEDVAVYRSTDSGETWTNVTSTYSRDSGLESFGSKASITFFNSSRGLITIGHFGGTPPEKPYAYVTRDGGHTWQQQRLPLPPQAQQKLPLPPGVSSQLISVFYPWPPKVFTAKDGIMRADYYHYLQNSSTGTAQETDPSAVLYVTHDSGTTWTYTTPLPLKRNDPLRQPSDFADMNHGWVADYKALYATTNSGRQWTTIRSTDFRVAKQLNFISPQIGWAVTDSVPFLLKTLDGGHTWTPVAYTISRQ